MEQQAVLSPPAQPRQQGGTDLWDGGIVGERFKAVVWKLLSQRLTEALKIFPGNQVVVGHHRIAGDVALRVLPRIVGEQADQHRLRVLRQPLFGTAFQQGRQVRKPADAKRICFPARRRTTSFSCISLPPFANSCSFTLSHSAPCRNRLKKGFAEKRSLFFSCGRIYATIPVGYS